MAHRASQYCISILTAQLWEYFTHTLTQMITDYFNAICSFFFFFAFMDFGKINKHKQACQEVWRQKQIKILGAQNTSYLVTQTIAFWERKCVVWYICLMSPAGRPARIASLFWHMVNSLPTHKVKLKPGTQGHPRAFTTFGWENFSSRKDSWDESKINIWGKTSQFKFQAKNLNAPIKASVHPSTEGKGSTVGAQIDCILGTPKRHSSWQLPRHRRACPRALARQNSPCHH